MFSRSDNKPFLDLSAELADELDWKAGTLRTFDHHLNITAWAYEAISGLLAIGTGSGTIDVYGGPGVDHRLQLSERVGIRSLHFASSLFRLLAVDERDRLNVWDLNSPNKPKLQSVVSFRHPVTYVAVSPSHSHAFIALANGEIQTYDLLCSRKSQYTAPNMWRLYEQKALASGAPSNAGPSSQLPLELVIHPRDLNLLFVAYGGGIILSDLTQRNTLRAYEYVLPPGAPGGAGYLDPQLLTHRRPDVTSIAVHPCGHFFAVGYVDGSIVFWAIEDEDKPLLALTIEGDHDVNIADAGRLDEALSNPHKSSGGAREPIFKLAWSGFPNSEDPRGGHTVLSVLGGLKSDDTPGVTAILLSPFNPPEPPALGAPSNTVHPDIRAAMRASVTPANLHTYSTVGTPQDFLLLPRDSPHFSGAWDPHAILLLSDGSKDSRVVEAYQFPPPIFAISKITPTPVSPEPKPVEGESSEDVLSDEIAATLESMKLNDDPKPLILPPALWNGPSGVVAGELVSLEKEAYGALTMDNASSEDSIRLKGGAAWVEDLEGQMKLIRFQPHRILVTYHSDLTVHFRDLSSQLLLSGDTSPMKTYFPNPVPSLTIDLLALLADASVASHVPDEVVAVTHIVSTHLATQSLECAVVLSGGEVAVFRLGAPEDSGVLKALDDPELISTAHILPDPNRRFHPLFLLIAGRGPVSALAISDIGFIAVAYKDGSLFVIDMRGPRVIKREIADKQSHRRSILHRQDVDVVQSLTWTVAGTESDIFPRVRLLAVRESGYTAIYTLSRSPAGDWTVNDIPETTEAMSHAIPGASFVINVKSGTKIKADRSGLAEVLGSSAEDAIKKKSFWISAGAKGVKCVIDITGDRIGKADWPSKFGNVEKVAVVKKSNVVVLVAHTDKREALIYSLPFLEHMHSLQLPQSHNEPLSADDTGDYVEWLRHPNGLIHAEKYGTLFNVRRSAPYDVPSVDFTYGRGAIPYQPQPVSVGPPSIVSSFLEYITSKTLSGDQIDLLLAGPDRPMPVKLAPRARSPEAGDIDGEQGSLAPNARNIANSASAGANSLYNRLGNALAERGEMLSGLQESFDALETGSKNMVSQAKTLAAQQSAKRWFQF